MIEPLAPLVDVEYLHNPKLRLNILASYTFASTLPLTLLSTLTNRLIPVTFALLSHASEQVRRSAHAVIHSLLALAPVPLAQSLVPSYCRIALASALKDDVPVPSASNNAPIADYLYERYSGRGLGTQCNLLTCQYSMAAIFRRMSPPVALVAVRALASAAMNAVVSSSDGIQHKKLILLLLAQTVVQVYPKTVDISFLVFWFVYFCFLTNHKRHLYSGYNPHGDKQDRPHGHHRIQIHSPQLLAPSGDPQRGLHPQDAPGLLVFASSP